MTKNMKHTQKAPATEYYCGGGERRERGCNIPFRQMMPYRGRGCRTNRVYVCVHVGTCTCACSELQCCKGVRPTTVPYIAFRAASMIYSLTASLPLSDFILTGCTVRYNPHTQTHKHTQRHTRGERHLKCVKCIHEQFEVVFMKTFVSTATQTTTKQLHSQRCCKSTERSVTRDLIFCRDIYTK